MMAVDAAQIEAEILKLIEEYSTADNIKITRDMQFEHASVSSLDVLQIIFRLEETHGFEIDTAAFEGVKTISDVVDYVTRQVVN